MKMSGDDGGEILFSIAFCCEPIVFEVPHAETNYLGYDPCREPS